MKRQSGESGAASSKHWPLNSQDSDSAAGTQRGSSSSRRLTSSTLNTSPSPARSGKRSIGEYTHGKRGNTIFWSRIQHALVHSIYPPAGGGFPGAQGKDISQPGATENTTIRSLLYHRDGEGRSDTAKGYVPQDRPAYLGRTLFKPPRVLPTDSAKSQGLQRQANINGASEHHGRDGGNSGTTNVGVSGSRSSGIH